MSKKLKFFLFAVTYIFASFCLTLSAVTPTAGQKTGAKQTLVSSFSLAEAADLDQCANGGVDGPFVPCEGTAWQNGNLGRNQAHYLEGDSVPYRLRFSGLVTGAAYTVTIEWDTTENSGAKHALDYLTSFGETETTANPCSGVADCILTNKTTFAIPMDYMVEMGYDGTMGTADDVVQKPGFFTLYNGTITGVSDYTMTGTYSGASQTRITITFTSDAKNPVLAWGGHISTRMDWGVANSAIAITGSPYHMRLIDLNGSGGNQDRSLSSEATIFPGSISVIKDATPKSTQTFDFTAAGPGVWSFSLMDDGTGTANSQNFSGLTNFGTANAVTISESFATEPYTLSNLACTEFAAGGSGKQNSTVDVIARTANIILEEGEFVTCTFINGVATAAPVSIGGQVATADGRGIKDAILTLTNAYSGEVTYARSNPFGYYRFDGLETGTLYMIHIRSKIYVFDPDTRMIDPISDLTDVDFIAVK
jgi:hypothetical protein